MSKKSADIDNDVLATKQYVRVERVTNGWIIYFSESYFRGAEYRPAPKLQDIWVAETKERMLEIIGFSMMESLVGP